MLSPEAAQTLFTRALGEFAPEWESIVPVTEITNRDPENWLSGIGTFGTTLRHRTSGAIKVLGRRNGGAAGASYHRGISHLVLQAYSERNTDPMSRYLEEVGIASPPLKAGGRKLGSFRAG
jgi:hypothetical protein